MLLAERYKMPVLTFIDTPGAYPGIDSEARGINEAIAENLAVMSRLKDTDHRHGHRGRKLGRRHCHWGL